MTWPATWCTVLQVMKALGAVAWAVVVAAPGPATAAAPGCVPGTQIECACVGGTRSVQVCGPDGASFQPCQCAASPAVPPPRAGFTLAPGPAPGSLQVSAATPASILVDGGDVGRAPVRVGDLTPGVHVVAARFEDGGETRKKVHVAAGEAAVLVMEPPPSAVAGGARKGLHLGVGVGTGAFGASGFGPGAAPELALNYGAARWLDLRFGARAMVAYTDGLVVAGGVPLSARFNIGSVFSLGVGGFVGVRYSYAASRYVLGMYVKPRETGLAVGPEFFPAILRLGAKRALELGLVVSLLFPLTSTVSDDPIGNRGAFGFGYAGINVTYLLL